MQKKFPWLGAALILVGALLLMRRIGFLSLHWHDIAWGLIALYGAVKVVNGLSTHASGKAFGGSVLFLVGVVGLVHPVHLPVFQSISVVSVSFLVLGISLLTAFLSNTREWHLFIPSFFFLGLGVLFVATDYDYLYRWDFVDVVSSYWPLALVLFGVSLILNRRTA
jgi:hypothetical protein